MQDLSHDDIEAALIEGLLDEEQAQQILTLSKKRQETQIGPDDEPFQITNGLNDILVAVGLFILTLGVFSVLLNDGRFGASDYVKILSAFIIMTSLFWGLAEYYTKKRRMIFTSMFLVMGISFSFLFLLIITMYSFESEIMDSTYFIFMIGFLGSIICNICFYLRFKFPFSLFVLTYSLSQFFFHLYWFVYNNYQQSEIISHIVFISLQVINILLFYMAVKFDGQDPLRLTKKSACAFWIHLAVCLNFLFIMLIYIINYYFIMNFYIFIIFFFSIMIISLIIDRRALLLSSGFFLSFLIYWKLYVFTELETILDLTQSLFTEQRKENFYLILLFIGLLLLIIGLGWPNLRALLLRKLPDFPGKTRLPPYATPPSYTVSGK